MIHFTCDRCGKTYSGADELVGQQAYCRKCGATFTVATEAAAKSPSARPAPAPQPRPAAAPTRRAPRRTAPTPPPASQPALPIAEVVTPASEFNIDLDAVSSFESPVLTSMACDPLGPVLTPARPRRRTKQTGGWLWPVFGGSGIAAVAVVAILAVLAIDLLGGGKSDPTAYLPSNYSLAMSLRVRHLMERAATVPQFKQKIEEALANNALSEGFDPRDVEEMFIVTDGQDGYLAARLARPLSQSSLPGSSPSGDSHQGLPIYAVSNRRPAKLPIGFYPKMQTMYCVMPEADLLVFASKPERLKEAIDRAKTGGGGRLDLPRGYDLALRD